MEEFKIKEFLRELFNKKIQTKWYDGSPREMEVIEKEGRIVVEQMIRQFLLENHDGKVGELEAKVYTYEKIIANSNFAPILEKENKAENVGE